MPAKRRAASLSTRSGLFFAAPFVLAFGVFYFFPILAAFYFSLTHWNGIKPPRFAGAGNYTHLFAEPEFWNALLNTLEFTAINVALAIGAALALALALDKIRIARAAFRAAFFAPAVVSTVVVALVWKLIYNPEFGLLSTGIARIGHALGAAEGWRPEARWLESPALAIPALALANAWSVAGLLMVILLAALQTVPETLHEAARLDGANAFQRFLHVTLPSIKPTLFFAVLITLFDSLQVFVMPQIMTRGGLDRSSDTVVLYLYRQGFEFFRLGYASAAGVALFAITALATLAVRKLMGATEGGLLPE